MLHKLLSLFVFTNFWRNPSNSGEFGIFDDRGNVFRIEEQKYQNTSAFHFIPFLHKPSFLQKFSYEKNTILYDFCHEKTGHHFIDILYDNGKYFRMKLNDTTLYQDIHKNMYRRFNSFGDRMLCDFESNTCEFTKNSIDNHVFFYKFIKCMGDLQVMIDCKNNLIMKDAKNADIFSCFLDGNINVFDVQRGSFNLFYIFTKDDKNHLSVFTFRYECNRLYFKNKSSIILDEHLDMYIAYPYIFLYVNIHRVNIYHTEMLQSKYFLSPPLSCHENDKIFFHNKKLFFFREKQYRNVSYKCLKHFL